MDYIITHVGCEALPSLLGADKYSRRIVSTPSEHHFSHRCEKWCSAWLGIALSSFDDFGFPRIHLVFQPASRREAALCRHVLLGDNSRISGRIFRFLFWFSPKSESNLCQTIQIFSFLDRDDGNQVRLDNGHSHKSYTFLQDIRGPFVGDVSASF